MKVKRPKSIRWCHPRTDYATAHRVQSGDSFVSLAAKYGFTDPWDIIRYNYGTKDPEEVNWYLQELVGCTKSKDGLNYSFDSSDKFGTVYIPHQGWKPGQEEDFTYTFSHVKDSRLGGSDFRDCPYVQSGQISSIFNEKIFIVGDESLRVSAEYNYGNIIFVSLPRNSRQLNRSGACNSHWLYKEMIHVAYGVHGMNMPYSARTEAVALIGAMVKGGRGTAHTKLPFDAFRFPGVSQLEFFGLLDTFLAEYKRSPGSANLDPIVRLVQKGAYMTRRLQGQWPIGKAA